jgi:acyl carrier protein
MFAKLLRSLSCIIVGCAIIVAGCSDREETAPAVIVDSRSTVDQVCRIVAELLGVDRKRIAASTSLADLRADELDFVELVMELEDQFNIAIPDDTAERLLGTDDWQQGMKNVTMAKLASLVDERKQVAQPDGIQASPKFKPAPE